MCDRTARTHFRACGQQSKISEVPSARRSSGVGSRGVHRTSAWLSDAREVTRMPSWRVSHAGQDQGTIELRGAGLVDGEPSELRGGVRVNGQCPSRPRGQPHTTGETTYATP